MSEYVRETPGGLALVLRLTARPGRRDELLQVLDEGVALCSEHEPAGALSATFHVSPSNADVVVLYEHYPNRASLAEHQANYQRIPAYGEARERMNALLAVPIEVLEVATPVVRFRRAEG